MKIQIKNINYSYRTAQISTRAIFKSALFLLSIHSVVAEAINDRPVAPIKKEKRNLPITKEYGKEFELKIRETVRFNDGLSISLNSFSHKRPYVKGPTKAMAYLSVSKGPKTGEVTLAIHGVEGKSKEEDGLSDSERYENGEWGIYTFELKDFRYNESVRIVINQKK